MSQNFPFEYQKVRPRIPIESGWGSPVYVDDQDQLQGVDRGEPAIDPSLVGAWRQPDWDVNAPRVDIQQAALSDVQQPPVEKPRVNPVLPSATTPAEPAPEVSPYAPELEKVGAPPQAPVWNPIVTGKHGRPEVSPTVQGDPLDIATAEQSALQRYRPKNAHGWHRYLPALMAGAALGSRGGHGDPWGAAGGAIVGALTGQFNPTWADDQWKLSKEREVGGRIKTLQDQRRADQSVAASESLIQSRQAAQKTRDAHQKYVESNGAIQNILKEYNGKANYDPDDPTEMTDPNSLTQRAAKLGMTLRPRNAAQRGGFNFEGKRWEYGPDGKPKPLTDENGEVLTDPMYTQRIENIKDTIRHRKVEEAGMQTRNKIAQQRLNIAQANGAGQAKFNTQFNAAKTAVNRFNELTRQADSQDSYGDPEGKKRAAILQQRDALENQIRDQYGDLTMDDEKGKRSVLRPRWSVSQFKAAHPGANVQQAQQQAMDDGKIVIP